MPTTTLAPLSPTWVRAIDRATRENVIAVKVDGTHYAVMSHTLPGVSYTITLSPAGEIKGCTCQGWGTETERACKHAGAVMKILLARKERKESPVQDGMVQSLRGGKSSLFLPE